MVGAGTCQNDRRRRNGLYLLSFERPHLLWNPLFLYLLLIIHLNKDSPIVLKYMFPISQHYRMHIKSSSDTCLSSRFHIPIPQNYNPNLEDLYSNDTRFFSLLQVLLIFWGRKIKFTFNKIFKTPLNITKP